MRRNKVIFEFSKKFSRFEKGDEQEFNIAFARTLQDQEKVGKILPRKDELSELESKIKDFESSKSLYEKDFKQRAENLDKRDKAILARENKLDKQVGKRQTK